MTDADNYAAEVSAVLAGHTEEWREAFFDRLRDDYCTGCGEVAGNQYCGCYSSPPENYA